MATIHGFRAFAAGLSAPQIHDAIGELAPLGPIQRYSTPLSVWRHYAHLTQFPLGLLAIGDAICHFNPTYGQGISCAAQQAQALGELLSDRDGPAHGLDTLATRFFARAEQISDAPWQQMALEDLAFPEAIGERPRGLVFRRAYSQALKRLAITDPEVQRLLFQVLHLSAPIEALGNAELQQRVMAALRESDEPSQ
jgi:2-polyprenyl-6-methoxyphenol hydroxylase-like FAD-dependent oxidoreductase